MRMLIVAVTEPNRRSRDGSLILRGTGSHKMAVVHRSSCAHLDPRGKQLVEVESPPYDTRPDEPLAGICFYHVQKIRREDLRGADGIAWHNSLYFSQDEAGMIAMAFTGKLKQFYRGEGRPYGVEFPGVKRLLTRIWTRTDMAEEELISYFSKPVCIREFSPDYLIQRDLFKKGRVTAFDLPVLAGQKWHQSQDPKGWVSEAAIRDLDQLEARYQEATDRQRRLLFHHPLWLWLQQQPIELKVELCQDAGWDLPADIFLNPLIFFGTLRPLEAYGRKNDLIIANLINDHPYQRQ